MPPKKRKSKEGLVETPKFIQPKRYGAKPVKTTATSTRPKRSTAVTNEVAEVSSAIQSKRKKIQDLNGIAASKQTTKRVADETEVLNGEVKNKKLKTTAAKKDTAPTKSAANISKSVSKSKAKLPPFIKGNSGGKRPVGRPRGRPPKAVSKSLKIEELPKTPEPKTPESSDIDISSLLPANARRESTFSVEITKQENNDVQGLGEEDEDEIGDEEEDEQAYWLMKAEPESRIEKGIDVKFSIDDLENVQEPEPWNGVRNFAARNNMRLMRKGELAFFYHSNCKVPGVAGIMKIVQEHSVDRSALDPDDPYYDAKATEENPRWEVVHVELERKFREIVSLKELKKFAIPGGGLENMATLKQSRLSVSKVSRDEWDLIVQLANRLEAEKKTSDAEIKVSASDNEMPTIPSISGPMAA
ncbi:MAG: hypothetical protein M1812_006590 [Candelaria pacifica]|nr:MAG: hypothetical protein M1812_006590 [Candelaria pacifica]